MISYLLKRTILTSEIFVVVCLKIFVMITMKVFCLPQNLTQETLNALHKEIVKAATKVPALKIKDEKGLMVLFVPDMMQYGTGKYVYAEVDGMVTSSLDTYIAWQQLVEYVGEVLKADWLNSEIVDVVFRRIMPEVANVSYHYERKEMGGMIV
jgi:hypothetical protein